MNDDATVLPFPGADDGESLDDAVRVFAEAHGLSAHRFEHPSGRLVRYELRLRGDAS